MSDVLSHEEMRKVIADGGSVLHGQVLITRVEDLPSEAVLAQGDAKREAAARDALDAQIAVLSRERAQLDHPNTVPGAPHDHAGHRPDGTAGPATEEGEPESADKPRRQR